MLFLHKDRRTLQKSASHWFEIQPLHRWDWLTAEGPASWRGSADQSAFSPRCSFDLAHSISPVVEETTPMELLQIAAWAPTSSNPWGFSSVRPWSLFAPQPERITLISFYSNSSRNHVHFKLLEVPAIFLLHAHSQRIQLELVIQTLRLTYYNRNNSPSLFGRSNLQNNIH